MNPDFPRVIVDGKHPYGDWTFLDDAVMAWLETHPTRDPEEETEK